MREFFSILVDQIVPSVRAVLRAQGVPDDVEPASNVIELAERAVEMFGKLANPVGLMCELDIDKFGDVYEGEGLNEDVTPLEDIYKRADHLALFGVTVGEGIGQVISSLFDKNDLALGSMLDSAASEGVENAAQELQRMYIQKQSGTLGSSVGALRFSPGYCGWHITAQRKLFDLLDPDETVISLNESCLMSPLKSISGVLVIGRKEIFDFDDSFPFCSTCSDHSCRDRIRSVLEQ